MRIVRFVLSPLLVALFLTACSDDEGDGDDGVLQVLASNSIVADWIANVGGEGVEVESIIPAGADVHSFQLSPSSVRAIGDADILFLIGASLEASFEDVVEENANGPVVQLAEGLSLRKFEGHAHEGEEEDEHDDGDFDPHIWMDADLAIAAVERIADELAELDPGAADTFRANAAGYAGEIRQMDATIAATLSGLSAERKLLVTFHDAYGYFADRYGLTVLGFVVENADEEPSAAAIAALVTDMREADASKIYIEPQFSARVVEQVAAEANAEVRTIPSDALADEYPTYIALMEAIAHGIAS